MIRKRIAAAVAVAAALIASATAITTATSPTAQAAASVPVFDHIVLVMFENHAYSQLNGSSSAPYFNSLAGQGAKFTQSYGVTHPSEPNYLAIFSGSTQGVTDDSCPHTYSGNNLGTAADHRRARPSRATPRACPPTATPAARAASYKRKHNGWVNFTNVPAASNLSFTAFPSSTNYASLPTVSFVTPNMCNDMHDCSVGTGDTWLQEQPGRVRAVGQDAQQPADRHLRRGQRRLVEPHPHHVRRRPHPGRLVLQPDQPLQRAAHDRERLRPLASDTRLPKSPTCWN